MSKLARAITATMTQRRVALHKPLKYTDIKFDSISPSPTGTVYRIGVTLGKQLVVPDFDVTISKDWPVPGYSPLDKALYDMKQAIIQEIFGEFRPQLIELKLALYDQDTDRARQILNTLEKNMFEDGVEE